MLHVDCLVFAALQLQVHLVSAGAESPLAECQAVGAAAARWLSAAELCAAVRPCIPAFHCFRDCKHAMHSVLHLRCTHMHVATSLYTSIL